MPPAVLALFLSLGISVTATPIASRIAFALGALDRAGSSRKVHGRAVPRLGGLAILAGTYGAFALSLVIPSVRDALAADARRVVALAAGGLAIALVGFRDDLRGTGAAEKLAVQLAVGSLLYVVGFRIERIDNPFGPDLPLGPLSLPITLLWIAGISNAMNLIDGLDGLAGGVAVAAAAVAFALGARAGDGVAMLTAAALGGATLGFLVYNTHPAAIFMGDTGSLFVGTILGALALRPHEQGASDVPLLATIVALGLPIADTLLAMWRRACNGVPLFRPDGAHVYHRLLGLGLSHRTAVLRLWAGATILAAAGVHLGSSRRFAAAVLAAVLLGGTVALARSGMLVTPGCARDRRRRNHARFRAVRLASRRLRLARSLTEVMDALADSAPDVGVRALRLRVGDDRDVPAAGSAGVATLRLELDPSRPGLGSLVAELPRREVDRDTETALEALCAHVCTALGRIEAGGRPEHRCNLARVAPGGPLRPRDCEAILRQGGAS